MATTEYLCRHFSRMGARLKVQAPRARQGEKVPIDEGMGRYGEVFDVRRQDGVVPEILDEIPQGPLRAYQPLRQALSPGGCEYPENRNLRKQEEQLWECQE